jgi:hypothetical protein
MVFQRENDEDLRRMKAALAVMNHHSSRTFID